MKPVDIIVLCLALVVGITISLSLVSGAILERPYDADRGKLIGQLLASIVAIVSMYVGARLNERDK